MGVLDLGLGAALILGGSDRTSSKSYAAALQIMPASFWGLAFLVGGIVCLSASRFGRAGAMAVTAGAGVHTFWCMTLIMSAFADTKAGLTGIVVYGWAAFLHFVAGMRLARQAA